MSAKMVLDMAAMQEDFFEDSALIGIVSTLPMYRFCWLMNERIDMNFMRRADMDILLQAAGKEHFFPIYQYCTPLNGCQHTMYKLKCKKESLLPEVKQLDYLWLIQSSTAEADAQEITTQLRSISEVQLAQSLQPERLKHISHLLV